MDKIIINQVEQHIAPMWKKLRPRFEQALAEHGKHWGQDWYSVLDSLEKREAQLHIVFDMDAQEIVAFFLTEIAQTKVKLTLRIMFLEGNGMHEWLDKGMKYIQALADRYAVEDIELYGRRGWERVLTPYGFNLAFVCLRKPTWVVEKRKKL